MLAFTALSTLRTLVWYNILFRHNVGLNLNIDVWHFETQSVVIYSVFLDNVFNWTYSAFLSYSVFPLLCFTILAWLFTCSISVPYGFVGIDVTFRKPYYFFLFLHYIWITLPVANKIILCSFWFGWYQHVNIIIAIIFIQYLQISPFVWRQCNRDRND